MSPAAESRRSQRLRASTTAKVIVGRHRMQAVIRSASESGLGVDVMGPQVGLVRGAAVKIAFELYGRLVELPGKVAWRGGGDDDALGIQLQLEIAGRSWRSAYACWLRQLSPPSATAVAA